MSTRVQQDFFLHSVVTSYYLPTVQMKNWDPFVLGPVK